MFSQQPPRIVSLLSSATEMLYALGLGEQVLAVSHECDWPAEVARKPRVTYSRVSSSQPSLVIDAQVRRLIAAGEPLYGIDEDLLNELRPDLIVTQAQCDVCAVRYEDVAAAVARSPALSATRIVSLNPMSLADVLADISRVAEAAGVAERGVECVAKLTERVEAVRTRTASLIPSKRPRTIIVEWIEPLMLAGNWTPELLHIAGGHCPLVIAGRHSVYNDWAAIVAFDPEVIVVAPCGFDIDRTRQEMPRLAELPHWSELSAVKSGRVHAVDGNAYFNRSGPRLVESLEILHELVLD